MTILVDIRLGVNVLGTSVLWYSSTDFAVLVGTRYSYFKKNTCTRTCTQVLLKIKVLLTSTYEYFTSTIHLKLIQNSSHTNHQSV